MTFFTFIWQVIQKAITFQIITGLSVNEFDNIYDKKIAKRHDKHELKRLSLKSKDIRVRVYGAGRSFKSDIKNRFLMLLVYYRLYIVFNLAGFLFDLVQCNVCREKSKIEYGI